MSEAKAMAAKGEKPVKLQSSLSVLGHLTVLGKSEGVEYVALADGRFAIVFDTLSPMPHKTKYGTPCIHFGGRGQDRPVFKTGSIHVAVNPGTLSAGVDREAKDAARATARIQKVLGGIDPAILRAALGPLLETDDVEVSK